MVPLPGPTALAPSGPPPAPARLLLLPTPAPEPAAPAPPRKRQRLAHLSPEEKALRRKLKNRVAAQSARDRKKARMGELERQAVELEAENQKLLAENQRLRERTHSLALENQELRLRLGLPALEGGGGSNKGDLHNTDPTSATVTASPAVLKVEMLEPQEEEKEEQEEGKGGSPHPSLFLAAPTRPAPGSAESAALSLRVPPQQGQAQTSLAGPGAASSCRLHGIQIFLTLQALSLISFWAFWTAWIQTFSSATPALIQPAWSRRRGKNSSRSIFISDSFWAVWGREKRPPPYQPPRVWLWGPRHPSWRPLMN